MSFTHHVVQVNERVIDGHNLHLFRGESSSGHQTADTAKTEMWKKDKYQSGL